MLHDICEGLTSNCNETQTVRGNDVSAMQGLHVPHQTVGESFSEISSILQVSHTQCEKETQKSEQNSPPLTASVYAFLLASITRYVQYGDESIGTASDALKSTEGMDVQGHQTSIVNWALQVSLEFARHNALGTILSLWWQCKANGGNAEPI